MANTYNTPGVYVEEIPKLPSSIESPATTIPVFIGYTQKAEKNEPGDLDFVPTRITSVLEYEEYFGIMDNELITVNISDELAKNGKVISLISRQIDVQIRASKNIMYYQLQLFFANGGIACYVVSTGRLKSSVSKRSLKKGLDILYNFIEPALVIFPEGINLTKAEDLYSLYNEALVQSYNLKNRFVIMDVSKNVPPGENEIDFFRKHVTGNNMSGSLKFGAAYYPMLITTMLYRYIDSSVTINHKTITRRNGKSDVKGKGEFNNVTLNEILLKNNIVYTAIKNEIAKFTVTLPPSAAVAGVYSIIDNYYGVWKAPANLRLNNINNPSIAISDEEQSQLNIDANAGKSINAIRNFAGKGTLVWGARTLAGNDNEWRYISVCRFSMMVEESIRKALNAFTFEPNNYKTWTTIKTLTNNFLTEQWRNGALQGIKPSEAFFVHVGLGETMTQQDILAGKLIVEIGIAAVRPAEFIIINITVQMQPS